MTIISPTQHILIVLSSAWNLLSLHICKTCFFAPLDSDLCSKKTFLELLSLSPYRLDHLSSHFHHSTITAGAWYMFLSIWILSSSQPYEIDTDMIPIFKVERELSKLPIWTKLSDIWVYVLNHHHIGMFFIDWMKCIVSVLKTDPWKSRDGQTVKYLWSWNAQTHDKLLGVCVWKMMCTFKLSASNWKYLLLWEGQDSFVLRSVLTDKIDCSRCREKYFILLYLWQRVERGNTENRKICVISIEQQTRN